jgi:hypothetical protein
MCLPDHQNQNQIRSFEFLWGGRGLFLKHVGGRSSKMGGLRSAKCSSKMLQNLLYFVYKKTHVVFSFFISCNFAFSLMNSLVYVDIDQGIHKGKSGVARGEKRNKLQCYLPIHVFWDQKYTVNWKSVN